MPVSDDGKRGELVLINPAVKVFCAIKLLLTISIVPNPGEAGAPGSAARCVIKLFAKLIAMSSVS